MRTFRKTRQEPELPAAPPELEESVQRWGEKIFDLVDSAAPPAVFSKAGLYGSLMEWAMRDELLKTQLFRLIDVLPALGSSAEVSRHLKEYLQDEQLSLSPALKTGVKAGTGAAWLFGSKVKDQVSSLARQFMLDEDEAHVICRLRALHDRNIAFTVDLLGEVVLSETEADAYAARYLKLIAFLHRETARWPHEAGSNMTSSGPVSRLNVSIKISALYSQVHPADPETAIERISSRLRPILRLAAESGALVNIDMESFAIKDLTLELFKRIFGEPEFQSSPACGIAMQAYLKDTRRDIADLIRWARANKRRLTVRLVKGAYWDYETVLARQKGWTIPVFPQKAETDANFEALARMLLENHDAVDAAFGTHNVRSAAAVLGCAEHLGIDVRDFEFQMLYGMAEPVKAALLELGCRLREYCPVGQLLPGMAYLVRRLLENTSNEGFLANRFARGASREKLLKNPAEHATAAHLRIVRESSSSESSGFSNEPPTDFNRPESRERMAAAIREVRGKLGEKYPLLIDNRSVSAKEWMPSLNPANQAEVIGYAAQATVADADLAVEAALRAWPKWARTPAAERADLLEKIGALIHRDKALFCAFEILEAGKNWTEADADVAEAIDFCNYYASEMRRLGVPRRTQGVPGETNHEQWHARGIALVIAPWNFPLAILTGMTAAAVVSGNAVLMKPSDQTPVIASRLAQLFVEAGFPPGVMNLLSGPGSSVGAHLVSHPKVDLIAFTGSKQVGLTIWEAAGRTAPGQANLKKVICEMGGKNCMIVDSDADLDEAVAGCIASAFGYQGQKCSALSRLVLLEPVHDAFLERFIAAADSLRIGPAEIPGNVFGPVISRNAQTRILDLIECGKREAKFAWQRQIPLAPEACYVPPTIFTDVPSDSRLFREEIFGPVLAVSRARNFDEALALANDSEFALTGGCYSRSPSHIERARAEFVCGNLYINRGITGAIVERQPFGGFKMSGGGTKAGGPDYLKNFMVSRVVTENCLRRGFAAMDD